MAPLTSSSLIAAANSLVGVREEGGNNRGHMIEIFLRGVDQPAGKPWCAAFVRHVGYWSHYDYQSGESSWPLPRTASCYMLGEYARARGILRHSPEDGDVFLLWNVMLGRYAHTGIVARVREHGRTPSGFAWFDCDTIEGNTDIGGSRDGEGVMRRVRRFYPKEKAGDAFIRWTDLSERRVSGQPNQPAPTSPVGKVA